MKFSKKVLNVYMYSRLSYIQSMKAQARKLGMQIAVPVALPLRDDKTATYIRAINDNMTSDVQLVVTIVPTGERNTFKKV